MKGKTGYRDTILQATTSTRLPTWGGVVMSCHSVTLRVSTGQGHQTYKKPHY